MADMKIHDTQHRCINVRNECTRWQTKVHIGLDLKISLKFLLSNILEINFEISQIFYRLSQNLI